MDPDPEPDAALVRDIQVGPCQCSLYRSGTLDSVYSAGKLGKNAVARCVGDPPAVLGDECIMTSR